MRKTLLGISALAALAIANTAHAEDGEGWQLHGFGDISVKSDYVTPRGLMVVDDGATVQVLNGLVAVAPSGFAIHAGTWLDLNPSYNRAENITAVNEFDWFVGVSGPIAKGLTAGVEYSEFISGQPSVAFKPERNIEFSLKYADGDKDSKVTINPYAKLFWAVDSKSSTVVLGKAGDTFDVELGMVPTIKVGEGSLSAPTWITVGPESYWGSPSNGLIKAGVVPLKNSGSFGVFSTGLKGSVPLKMFKGGANASLYAQLQYYHLINDNLATARTLLTNSTGRDKLTFGAGISFGF
jgi:hypothetical protein